MNVLEISASGRRSGSVSRMLTAEIVAALEQREGHIRVQQRDLNSGVSLVDEAWIAANFTPDEERTAEQRDTLRESDGLVEELQAANVIVIGSPVYNFGIPAALKAWVDQVARARLTFRYTANGAEGLLTDKKAYIVIASGGVAVDSPVDFATPYLRQALAFIGITDVDVIAADQLNRAGEESVDAARLQIASLVYTGEQAGNQAA